jgi:heme-degrading monooxygenase HmoA
MTFVAINAIEVPAERSQAFAERFAKRAGMVSKSPGFVRFELLRPADGGTRWLVTTHWERREDFEGWLGSSAFDRGHGRGEGQQPASPPVATGSELWQFEVEQHEG